MATKDIEETRKALAAITAAALKKEAVTSASGAADAAPAPVTPPASSAATSTTSASSTTGGGSTTPPSGGGSGGGGSGSGASSGSSKGVSWSSKFFEGLTFEKAMRLLTSLLLALGAIWWATHDTPSNRHEEGMANTKFLDGMMNNPKSNGSVQATPEKTTIDSPNHFQCPTSDDVESGFLRANVEHIDTSKQKLHVNQGCLLVRFSGNLTKISGNYILRVPNKGPTAADYKWRDCGNGSPVPSVNHSNEVCLNMVNNNKSEDIRIVAYTSTTLE